MRIRRRRFGLYLSLVLAGGLVALGVYAYDVGFHQKYRRLIADELARYGLRADIGKLTLDPVEGLTAQEVRLYDETWRSQHLADISRISLDVDFGRLMNREDFLRSLTLSGANLSLRVDPADPQSEWIEVKDLNARLVVSGRQIEIAHAAALMSGVRLNVRGTVLRPDKTKTRTESPRRVRERRARQLRELRDRRGVLRSVLRVLDQFHVPAGPDGRPLAAQKAELSIDVQGELADLDAVEVRAALRGGPLACGKFMAAEFSADAGLSGGELNLKRLSLRDSSGTLTASAEWKVRRSDAIDCTVDSSINLVALIAGVRPDLKLPAGLDFVEPPHVRATGTVLTGAPFNDAGAPPVHVTGSVTTGGFRFRDCAFDRFSTDFAVREDGFIYLRNTELSHPTGTAAGQFMREEGGTRYQVEFDMAVESVRPLLRDFPDVEKALAPLAFTSQSHATVGFSGRRGGEESPEWTHAGRADLRDFRLRGAHVRQCSGEVTISGGRKPVIVLSQVLLRRDDGDLAARTASLDTASDLLAVAGVTCTAQPAAAVAMFAPKAGDALAPYHFIDAPPRVEADGVIDLRGNPRTDLRLKLNAAGLCGLTVAGEDWRFAGAAGSLHFKGNVLTLDLSGKTAPGLNAARVLRFDDATPLRIAGTFGLSAENRVSATKYTVRSIAGDPVVLRLSGREFPVEQFDTTVRCDGSRLTVNGSGLLFSGRFAAALEIPDLAASAHSGTVAMERCGFGRLTALFNPATTTGGSLSGRFTWKSPDGRTESIDGSGTAVLEDANIFALPLLGPLSALIDALLPGDNIAYSVARKATAGINVNHGIVTTPDFEAATRTFKLTASGSADLVRDSVDFSARVNLRGAPGFILYPVSKLFEYRANGTLDEPNWHAKNLPNPLRLLPRPKPPRKPKG